MTKWALNLNSKTRKSINKINYINSSKHKLSLYREKACGKIWNVYLICIKKYRDKWTSMSTTPRLWDCFSALAFRFKNTKNYGYLLGQTPLHSSLLGGNYYPDIKVDHCCFEKSWQHTHVFINTVYTSFVGFQKNYMNDIWTIYILLKLALFL